MYFFNIIILIIVFVRPLCAADTILEHSKISYQPANFVVTKGLQSFHVFYVSYDGRVIFKIADNVMMTLNSLLIKAEHENSVFIYRMPSSDAIVEDDDQLRRVLIAPEQLCQMVKLNASDIEISANGIVNVYKLKLHINGEIRKYVISKYLYRELDRIKLVAKNRSEMVVVDLNFLSNAQNFNNENAIRKSFRIVAEKNNPIGVAR